MPRKQRTADELEVVRERILDEALALFTEVGFDGFSMRKLGVRLNVSAKTIYNYFRSQDEIYLGLLTRGFRQLQAALVAATTPFQGPADQLAAAIEAYVEFGLTHANMYDLMFTSRVPRYDDYVGTPLEDVALSELEAALENQQLFAAIIADLVADVGRIGEDDLRFITIRIWTQMHGYLAGVPTVLGYMHPEPLAIRDRVVRRTWVTALADIDEVRSRMAGDAVVLNHGSAPRTLSPEGPR